MSQIDPSKLKEVEDKADVVLETPTPKQILKYLKVRDRVSYVGKDGKYRSGGFVMSIAADGSSFAITGGSYRWTLRANTIYQLFIVSR